MISALPQPLVGHARARPDHVALCEGFAEDARMMTFVQMRTQVQRLAAALAHAGVARGHRVALLGAHGMDFVLALHAVGWLDAVAVPLPRGGRAALLCERLHRSQATWCIALPGASSDAVANCQGTKGIRTIDWRTSLADVNAPVGFDVAAARWPLAAPRLIVETSGTSGKPAQVVISTAQIIMQSLGSATRLGHAVDDVWLAVLPLHHVGGLMLLFRALVFGTTVCLPGQFEASSVALLMQHGQVTLVSLVPTMLAMVLPLLDVIRPTSRLRAILLGGAPTPQKLLDAARAKNLPVAITWGMTEASSSVCVRWPHGQGGPEYDHDASNAGPPLPYVDVCQTEGGALAIFGPQVMQDDWLITSDVGQVLADGTVSITGRCDRTIISGGENIAAEELEAVLLSHPEVVDAAIVAMADSHWGERPEAHLVAAQEPIDDEALVHFCRARLASHKIPARFVWHQSLPRDAMGKLQRADLLKAAAGVL